MKGAFSTDYFLLLQGSGYTSTLLSKCHSGRLGLWSENIGFFSSVRVVSSVVKNPDTPQPLATPSRPQAHLNRQTQRLLPPAVPSDPRANKFKISSLRSSNLCGVKIRMPLPSHPLKEMETLPHFFSSFPSFGHRFPKTEPTTHPGRSTQPSHSHLPHVPRPTSTSKLSASKIPSCPSKLERRTGPLRPSFPSAQSLQNPDFLIHYQRLISVISAVKKLC